LMTMDLYGHLVDDNLWQAARIVGGRFLRVGGECDRLPRRKMRHSGDGLTGEWSSGGMNPPGPGGARAARGTVTIRVTR